jgi:hypothetical protein
LNPAFFVLFIVVIYLIGSLLKRWKKMSNEHGTFHVIADLFLCWCGTFAVVWVLPITIIAKIVVGIASSIAIIILGLWYLTYKGKIRRASLRKLLFILAILVAVEETCLAFSLAVLTWGFLRINGVYVVTYGDLLALGFGIMGFFAVYLTIVLIRIGMQRNRHNP